MISFVDKILVEDFAIEGGLSNNEQITAKSSVCAIQDNEKQVVRRETISVPRVAILDPACGTGSLVRKLSNILKTNIFLVLGQYFTKTIFSMRMACFPA